MVGVCALLMIQHMVKKNTAQYSLLEPVQGPERPWLLSFLDPAQGPEKPWLLSFLATLAVVLIRGKLNTGENHLTPWCPGDWSVVPGRAMPAAH